MKLLCGPADLRPPIGNDVLRIILYGRRGLAGQGSIGEAVMAEVLRQGLEPAPRAWDMLSLALSVIAADFAGSRSASPDGWTRDFDLEVAVTDPDFWNDNAEAISAALAFLTTDRWRLHFRPGGMLPAAPAQPVPLDQDCVLLLSGGLDSLIGAIDLAASGKKPVAVSQVVRGDAVKQQDFAAKISGGIKHLQLNHNVRIPGPQESSQRARSLIFIVFGVLAATTLSRHKDGETVPLYVCENGFIAINPPLTGARLGSLSTRTTHPRFLEGLQDIISDAGLRVKIENPYRLMTKGEMLIGCLDQHLIMAEAAVSTSCGRFQRFNYTHCGRCVPCQVRRAAFLRWDVPDTTDYVYSDLGREDRDHAAFDDVRSVAMALAHAQQDGLESWLLPTLSPLRPVDVGPTKFLIQRGLEELERLHRTYKVT